MVFVHNPNWLPVSVLDKVQVARMKDFGVMKLAVIFGRRTRKDFVDLYFILHMYP
jgi:hypothetical protein